MTTRGKKQNHNDGTRPPDPSPATTDLGATAQDDNTAHKRGTDERSESAATELPSTDAIEDAQNQASKKTRVDGIFVPYPSNHCLSETEDDRMTELQDFRPDNVRPGEPAVLDVERSHDARVEINRDLGGA